MSGPKLPEGWREVDDLGLPNQAPKEKDERLFRGPGEFWARARETVWDLKAGPYQRRWFGQLDAIREYVRATRRRTVEELRARLRELGAGEVYVSVSASAVKSEDEGGATLAAVGGFNTERDALEALVAQLEAVRS